MIDWNLIRPVQSGAPEVASITGLLGAIAEGRQKQKQQAAEAAFRQMQFEAQQRNIAADNARADQQLKLQQQEHEDAQAAAKATIQRQQEEAFNKTLPAAQMALRDNDLQGAQNAVQPYGGSVALDTSGQEAAQAAQDQRRDAAYNQVAGKVPQLGIFDLMTLPVQAKAHADRVAAPTADEQAQAAPRYKISGPAGKVLDYAPSEADAADQARYQRAAETASKALSGLGMPFSPRVLNVATANARAGATPEEAVTRGLASGQFAETQEGMDRRKKKTGGGGDGTGFNPKVETANMRALKTFQAGADRWFRTSGAQELQKAHEEAERAHQSLVTGNPAGAAHALEKFVSVSRGNAATAGALQLFQKHLSGFGGSIDAAIEAGKTGGFGKEQTANLRAALETVMGSINQQINDKHEAYVKANYTPALYNLKGNVEDKEEELFGALGYHPQYDPDAPTIVPGSGQKSKSTGRGPKTEQKRKSPEDWVREYSK